MGDRVAETSGIAFFSDKSVGKAVPHALRRVGISVVVHDEVYDPNKSIPDSEWIEYACARGLVIVKCDKNIRRNPAEKATLVAGKARAFLLGVNAKRFDMLRHLLLAWKSIEEAIASEVAPFVFFVDENGKLHGRPLS